MHADAMVVLPQGSFPSGSGPIFLTELKCEGNEGNLLDCPNSYHTPPGLRHDCSHEQDVAIQCQGRISYIYRVPKLTLPGLCADTDECPAICEQICTDYVGSFNCSCNEGYSLDVDGYSCNGMIGS